MVIFINGKQNDKERGGDHICGEKKIYTKIYEDLGNILSNPEDIRKIYAEYAGTTVTFPKKLYSQEYAEDYITEHYQIDHPGKIAKYLGMTERRVRQIMQKIRLKGQNLQ